ncbi:SAM-dependent methyltransferase [Pseudobacteriovorax antillogorgiicola]|uniref:Mycolic acid cyclopropane synthetase n=1 Tax=Pseudobacteriovorax antillogorgiicola TaxID=1513793 RepID=A0A1Y6C0H9_9BACT|nr:class I SAM-dependent methyltransferase [Pseudobacteriovorax antillogorgiicola]TCS52322.1 mycolic acid cyclopropane synthetase [Pseudobacteriovorax antillogorgiicola]SMF30047.1 Mycolic acid cyclopropane synthetase [Pseudobacteriovorax antillogorgiicola]
MMNFALGSLFGFCLFWILSDSFFMFCLRSVTLSLFGKSEFFDQQEQLLNIEQNSSWANLGYWSNTRSYPQAAKAMAVLLGERCKLNSHDKVIDIGFGNGDQLCLWIEHFQVREVQGFNISESQNALARRRTRALERVNIFQGSFQQVPTDTRVDKILALDCAYHFQSRETFFSFCHKTLNPEGGIGLVDLTVNLSQVSFIEKGMVRLMAAASKIPLENLVDRSTYEKQLSDHHLELLEWEDISEQVFSPFSQFVAHHHTEFASWSKPDHWFKYRISAWVLQWLYERRLISLAVIIAKQGTK